MEEIWKDIEGYEGLFRVSNLGNVYDIKKEELVKQYNNSVNDKHQIVFFSLGKSFTTKKIHRLVAEAFVPNTDNKPHVHHIDHNPQNNRADNLMWVTAKEHIELHKKGRISSYKKHIEEKRLKREKEQELKEMSRDMNEFIISMLYPEEHKVTNRFIRKGRKNGIVHYFAN